MNFDPKCLREKRLILIKELEEIWMNAYENTRIYKEHTKTGHGKKIFTKVFVVNNHFLLFNSCLKLFPWKVQS